MRSTTLVPPADRLRLERAVVEAETATAGELVLAIVRSCDRYDGARWRLGTTLAAIALLSVAITSPGASPGLLLGAAAAGLALGHLVARLDVVRARLIPPDLAVRRAEERSRRCFAESGLARSPEDAGILIFVALLERRVVVLAGERADRARGGDESWQSVVDAITAGLRAGQPLEGFETAIALCAPILARLPASVQPPGALPSPIRLEG